MGFVDAAVLMGAKPPTSSSISSSTNWLSLGAGVGSVGAAKEVGTASGCELAGEGTAVLSLLEEGSASVVASIPPVGFEKEETSSGGELAPGALLSGDV